MGKLSKKDVEHVAKLAKLNLSSQEIDKFRKQLSNIIDYIEKLDKVDTSNVKPTSQSTGLINIYRKDELQKDRSLSQEQALSNAKGKHNGYFVVPMVLEEKTI